MISEKIKNHRPISVSSLKVFAKSPLAYWHKYLSGETPVKKQSKPKEFGNAWHTYNLQFNIFDEKYIINDLNRNTNEFKAIAAEAEAKGQGILKTPDKLLLEAMKRQMDRTSEAKVFLEADGKCEDEFFGENAYGFKLKGYIDKFIPDCSTVLELKTISSINEEYDVQKQIYDLEYLLTVPHYLELTGAQSFKFLFQETSAPYDSLVYEIEGETLQIADQYYATLIKSLAYCIENDSWPGVGGGLIKKLDLPPWLREKLVR